MAIAEPSLITNVIQEAAQPLEGGPRDYDPLLKLIGEARFCLLGEATHGTYEFYRERAEITKRLIKEKGFTATAVEADWPDAFRVNRYLRGLGDDGNANEALGGFKRFPTWMWRNTVVEDFVEWLREYNASLPQNAARVGFYGLDLYSLYTSIESVLSYLNKVDPEAAKRARYRYSCFEHFAEDTQAYGYAANFGITESCESDVIEQLVELRRRAADYASRDGRVAQDEFFFAEQNSYEASFHEIGAPNFVLPLRDNRQVSAALRGPRLERAIGVIYMPQTERQSHYFEARLSDQFDAVVHFDETQALEPLERYALWETGEPPETFPTGM